MKLNDDSIREVADRFMAEHIDSVDGTESARHVLDRLMEYLAGLGYGEEDMFAVHLAVEEAIMQRLQKN